MVEFEINFPFRYRGYEMRPYSENGKLCISVTHSMKRTAWNAPNVFSGKHMIDEYLNTGKLPETI